MMNNDRQNTNNSLRISPRRKTTRLLAGRSRGQAIVLIALMMVVLLGFTALAVDGGELYLLRRKAQNAADAAAIAAVWQLCKDPNQPDPAPGADPNAVTTPITRTRDAIEGSEDTPGETAGPGAITAAGDNGFTIAATDVTFPDAASNNYDHVLVTVTASKAARLIQVVYTGPLTVSAYAEGTCTKATSKATGMALVGLGACDSANGDGLYYSGAGITVTGGYSTNGTASWAKGTLDACPVGWTGSCTTAPVGTTVLGTSPASSGSGVTYTVNPVTAAAVNYPPFWSISDFQTGGQIFTVAQELGVFYAAPTGDVSDWSAFPKPGGGHFSDDGSDLIPGIYYVNGDVTGMGNNELDTPARLSNVTLVATGTIDVGLSGSASNVWTLYKFPRLFPADTADGKHLAGDETGVGIMPVLFAANGHGSCEQSQTHPAVNSTGQFKFVGVIYAPQGACSISFDNGGSADGALICLQVHLTGSGYSINFNPLLMPPLDPSGGIAH